jgi:hypothetical protein
MATGFAGFEHRGVRQSEPSKFAPAQGVGTWYVDLLCGFN